MWNVIERTKLTQSLADDPWLAQGMSAWDHAGSILSAVYRWTKDKRNTTRKGSAEYKRYTTLMDKLQKEIKRG